MIVNSHISNKAYNKTKLNVLNTRANKAQGIGANNSLSFGKMSNNLKISFLLGGLFLGGIFANEYFRNNLQQNEKEMSKDIGWGKNVRVLASNGQNLVGESSAYLLGGNSSYSKSLTDKLNEKDVNSIEQANDSLIKNGYKHRFKKFFPLETPGTKLEIFNKNDKNKDRFMFVFAQYEDMRHEFISDDFIKDIEKTYNIPKENIIKIVSNSKKDFLQGIDSISAKIDKLKNKKNAEVLVYYTGHGEATAANAKARKLEGAMEGSIVVKADQTTGELTNFLKESEVKNAFSKKLKTVKTLFILDTCHAGAWIADNTKNKASKTLRLFA